jgi:hypothetical protein
MQQVLTQISLVIKLGNSANKCIGSNLFELILGWGEECLLFKFHGENAGRGYDASQSNLGVNVGFERQPLIVQISFELELVLRNKCTIV